MSMCDDDDDDAGGGGDDVGADGDDKDQYWSDDSFCDHLALLHRSACAVSFAEFKVAGQCTAVNA